MDHEQRHALAALHAALLRVEARLDTLTQEIRRSMTPTLQALADQVSANTSVEQSAATLIQGMAKQVADLSAQITANAGDASAMAQVGTDAAALAASLKASSDALASAVSANTPAAPAPAPSPATSPAPDPTDATTSPTPAPAAS